MRKACLHTPTGSYQLTTATDFIRKKLRAHIDVQVRPLIMARVPLNAMSKENSRRLAKIPGALDLLHAITRRSFLPDNSSVPCKASGCRGKCSAAHILMCNDQPHLQALAQYAGLADANRIVGPSPSLHSILAAYASADRSFMIYVAARSLQLTDDVLAQKWARWILDVHLKRIHNTP